ncbi:hypothetical protein CLF_104349 [Clonorchis sinensis]|uniref:Uncharacterized protein n=1 Tax=Clonorchis sinensis TaxID=79923 RepID=G7YBG8_CLOSI|nr:hypothetical protein CLF_104349 [Clonorchis sinensis]
MDSEAGIKKSILKKQEERLHRSSSVTVGSDTTGHPTISSGSETPRKRAIIQDEDGVWLPGEQDDIPEQVSSHSLKVSIADRTAGERVSYKLIQQRSLDHGLYSQMNRLDVDPCEVVDEPSRGDDGLINAGTASTSDSSDIPRSAHDIGRIIVSHSPSEDTVIQLLQSTSSGHAFSLRDVLAHRLPVFNDEEEEEPVSGTEDKMATDKEFDKTE